MQAKSLCLLGCLSVALTACDGGGGTANKQAGLSVQTPPLAQGAQAVVMAGDGLGGSGMAFTGPSGQGFMFLASDSQQPAAVVYQRASADAGWSRAPETGAPSALTMQFQESMPNLPTPTLASLAGRYQSSFNGADSSGFQVNDGGQIQAQSGNGCQLSGTVRSSDYGGALGVDLNFSGCSQLAGAYSGIVFVDPNAPNAAFRIVAANGSSVLDFYAFQRG